LSKETVHNDCNKEYVLQFAELSQIHRVVDELVTRALFPTFRKGLIVEVQAPVEKERHTFKVEAAPKLQRNLAI
jgi:hypothetical protein